MILITGASGLLGANMVLSAQRQGRAALAVSHEHPIYRPGLETIQADLSQEDQAMLLLARYRPRQVIHCAAATNVDWCESHPEEALRLNAGMPRHLAAAAERIGARFVYISTDSVFAGDAGNYGEASEPCPGNVYARTKLEGEREVQTILPDALVARTNIYGWNAQEKKSLAEWILDELEQGHAVRGFSDVYFNPLLATDLSEILFEVMDRGLTGVFNMVGSEPISKYAFAREVAQTFGYDPERVLESRLGASALSAPRPRNTTLQTDKIANALGRPMPSVAAGLQRFKQQRENGFVAELKRLVRK